MGTGARQAGCRADLTLLPGSFSHTDSIGIPIPWSQQGCTALSPLSSAHRGFGVAAAWEQPYAQRWHPWAVVPAGCRKPCPIPGPDCWHSCAVTQRCHTPWRPAHLTASALTQTPVFGGCSPLCGSGVGGGGGGENRTGARGCIPPHPLLILPASLLHPHCIPLHSRCIPIASIPAASHHVPIVSFLHLFCIPTGSHCSPLASQVHSHCIPAASPLKPCSILSAPPLRSYCIPIAFLLHPYCIPTASLLRIYCIPLHSHCIPLRPSAAIQHPCCIPPASPLKPRSIPLHPHCTPPKPCCIPHCIPTASLLHPYGTLLNPPRQPPSKKHIPTLLPQTSALFPSRALPNTDWRPVGLPTGKFWGGSSAKRTRRCPTG